MTLGFCATQIGLEEEPAPPYYMGCSLILWLHIPDVLLSVTLIAMQLQNSNFSDYIPKTTKQLWG